MRAFISSGACAAVCLTSCAAGPRLGAAEISAKEIKAQTLSLVDSKGRERVRIGAESMNGRPAIVVNHVDGEPAIVLGLCEDDLADEHGTPGSADAAFFHMESADGELTLSAGVGKTGGSLDFEWDSQPAFTITTTKDQCVIDVAAGAGQPSKGDASAPPFVIRILRDEHGVPRIELDGPSGRRILSPN